MWRNKANADVVKLDIVIMSLLSHKLSLAKFDIIFRALRALNMKKSESAF